MESFELRKSCHVHGESSSTPSSIFAWQDGRTSGSNHKTCWAIGPWRSSPQSSHVLHLSATSILPKHIKTCSHIAHVHYICQQKFGLPFLKRHPTPSVRNQVSEISALMRHVVACQPWKNTSDHRGHQSIETRRFLLRLKEWISGNWLNKSSMAPSC